MPAKPPDPLGPLPDGVLGAGAAGDAVADALAVDDAVGVTVGVADPVDDPGAELLTLEQVWVALLRARAALPVADCRVRCAAVSFFASAVSAWVLAPAPVEVAAAEPVALCAPEVRWLEPVVGEESDDDDDDDDEVSAVAFDVAVLTPPVPELPEPAALLDVAVELDDWSDSTEACAAASVACASITAVFNVVGSSLASSWPAPTLWPTATETEATFAETGKCGVQVLAWVTLPVRLTVWVTLPSAAVAVT